MSHQHFEPGYEHGIPGAVLFAISLGSVSAWIPAAAGITCIVYQVILGTIAVLRFLREQRKPPAPPRPWPWPLTYDQLEGRN